MGSTCGLRGTDVTQMLGMTMRLRSTAVNDALAAQLGPFEINVNLSFKNVVDLQQML